MAIDFGGIVGGLTGRANTTAPVAEPETSPGLLSTIGGALGGLIGVPGVGTALGTIGDAYVAAPKPKTSTGTGTTNIPGRAVTALVQGGQTYATRGLGALGLTGLPRGTMRAAKLLTRWNGVSAAAEALGLTIEQTAYLATRPARRRGITAASLRTTRRTLRQVGSITRSLRKLKC